LSKRRAALCRVASGGGSSPAVVVDQNPFAPPGGGVNAPGWRVFSRILACFFLMLGAILMLANIVAISRGEVQGVDGWLRRLLFVGQAVLACATGIGLWRFWPRTRALVETLTALFVLLAIVGDKWAPGDTEIIAFLVVVSGATAGLLRTRGMRALSKVDVEPI